MIATGTLRLPMIDPDIRRLLDTEFNTPLQEAMQAVAELRAAAEQAAVKLGGAPEPIESVVDSSVRCVHGPTAVRVYRPRVDTTSPVMLYAHGGGWVTGSLDSHDRLCRILANRLAAIIVAVDYRRAPEHLYPAALDDMESAWHWAQLHAAELGGDGKRFVVAGDSSGGNLAAALTLRLRAQGALQPKLQLLLYPALDASCSRRAYREFASGLNLTAAQMQWYWNTYRGEASVGASELSPLASADLRALPPAVVAVAGYDVLRDDGVEYARSLEDAGVPVRLIRCEGMIHGFLRWTGSVPAALRCIAEIADSARQMLLDASGEIS